jgi:hypothetical protein
MIPAKRKNRASIMATALSVADKSRSGKSGTFDVDFIFLSDWNGVSLQRL